MPIPQPDATHRLPLAGRTLIFDVVTQNMVMWLDGVVSLPVGAVIQLGPPNVDASVVGIRLQAGKNIESAQLVLEVEIPPHYWEPEAT